jgi:hypothetical protein
MSPTLREGIRLLGVYTAGRFTFWTLAGNAKVCCRAHVMAVLLGVPRVPQSKAGINALREEFFRQAGIPRDCAAGMEHDFEALCQRGVAA